MKNVTRVAVFFAVAVIMAVFWAGCENDESSGGGGGAAYRATEYYPLGLGAKWVYVREDNSADTSITEVVDTTTIHGHLTYVVESYEIGSSSRDTSYEQVIDGAIYEYFPPAESSVVSDTSLCVLLASFSPGQSWVMWTRDSSGNSGGFEFHYSEDWTIAVLGLESVNVPAGAFNTVKLSAVFEYSYSYGDGTVEDSSADTTFSWLAPNVGMVKSRDTDGTVWNLVEYVPGEPVF